MPERIHAPHVGAADPEKRSSPVLEETDERFDELAQQLDENPVCYFNGSSYGQGSYVCSGDELLRCQDGAWWRLGSCDPDNP